MSVCSCCRWFAKRFLHPNVVAIYDFIFLWDEDLGVENFDPRRYDAGLVVLFLKLYMLHSTQHVIKTYRVVFQVMDISTSLIRILRTSCVNLIPHTLLCYGLSNYQTESPPPPK